MAAMLGYQTSPLRAEPFSCVKTFFCFKKFAQQQAMCGEMIYTAILRRVIEKNVYATIPEGNMGYD